MIVALLALHGGLALWALVGFLEWFVAEPPWPRISNPDFPRDVLFMQWSLVLLAGGVFIGGYATRWPNTPIAMACVYAAMAALCAVQTFTFMTSDTRFTAMGAEYAAYVAILVYLFRSPVFQPA